MRVGRPGGVRPRACVRACAHECVRGRVCMVAWACVRMHGLTDHRNETHPSAEDGPQLMLPAGKHISTSLQSHSLIRKPSQRAQSWCSCGHDAQSWCRCRTAGSSPFVHRTLARAPGRSQSQLGPFDPTSARSPFGPFPLSTCAACAGTLAGARPERLLAAFLPSDTPALVRRRLGDRHGQVRAEPESRRNASSGGAKRSSDAARDWAL